MSFAAPAMSQLTTGALNAVLQSNFQGQPLAGSVLATGSEIGGLSLSLTGWWTLGPFGGSATGNVTAGADWAFDIGNIPVRVEQPIISWDAKWVNGGGTLTSTITMPALSLRIVEAATGIVVFDRPPVLLPQLVGTGFKLYDSLALATSMNTVLAANTSYKLQFRVNTIIDYLGQPGAPMASVTSEFFPDDFNGFKGSLMYATVPAPGATALLGLAGVAARRRRLG